MLIVRTVKLTNNHEEFLLFSIFPRSSTFSLRVSPCFDKVVLACDDSILVVDANDAVGQNVNIGRILMMKASPNGELMAVVVEDGPLVVLPAGKLSMKDIFILK